MRLKIYLLFLIEQKDFYFSLDSCGLHLLWWTMTVVMMGQMSLDNSGEKSEKKNDQG